MSLPTDWARGEYKVSSRKLEDIVEVVTEYKDDEECAICTSPLSENPDDSSSRPICVRPSVCEHRFHLHCLRRWLKEKPSCPTCREQLIVCRGYQPPGGSFEAITLSDRLPGHPDCGTICIRLELPAGRQDVTDPMPSVEYDAFRQSILLPDNSEGRALRDLIRLAWNRALIVRIGWHPGQQRMNKLIFNGIEFHTSRSQYPDPSYLNRLRFDLGELGVRG